MEKCEVINKSVKEIRKIEDAEALTKSKKPMASFGAEVLRSMHSNKDIDLTPAQVVQCLCHLEPKKMADAIATINKSQKLPFQPIEVKTLDIPHPKEQVKQKIVGYEERGAAICTHCGSDWMRRNGTCWVCCICGETTGCG